jgi:DNA polymerase III epsilon subunit-like protein
MSTNVVSFDIETTGLEPGKHSIIELGAVIEDFETPVEDLPEFRCLIDNDDIVGSPYALGMHVDTGLLKELQDPSEDTLVLKPKQVAPIFKNWMIRNGVDFETEDNVRACSTARPVAAGKNVASFDIPHVETLPDWEKHIRFHHRVLDPGSMYFDPEKDNTPPDLPTCLERAGLDDEVAHTAVQDSLDVCRLIRKVKNVSLD